MRWITKLGIISLAVLVSGCGVFGGKSGTKKSSAPTTTGTVTPTDPFDGSGINFSEAERTTIWEAFGPNKAEQTVQVNRYLWTASLDVLDFLPVQSVDPFTGLIVTGYGTPPGGGRSYRATIHIKDPALDARALSVALHSKNGPVNASTTRAVEDAILSRARQIRIADSKL